MRNCIPKRFPQHIFIKNIMICKKWLIKINKLCRSSGATKTHHGFVKATWQTNSRKYTGTNSILNMNIRVTLEIAWNRPGRAFVFCLTGVHIIVFTSNSYRYNLLSFAWFCGRLEKRGVTVAIFWAFHAVFHFVFIWISMNKLFCLVCLRTICATLIIELVFWTRWLIHVSILSTLYLQRKQRLKKIWCFNRILINLCQCTAMPGDHCIYVLLCNRPGKVHTQNGRG